MLRFDIHQSRLALLASSLIVLLGLEVGFVNRPVHATANGQEAFCINPSHGEGGWSGSCRATGKEAHEDAVQHVKDNPTHKDDTTTKPCDLSQ